MLKLKMMLCVMMLPLVVVGCAKPICRSIVKPHTASGVDNAASQLADTAEQDYFTLEVITMPKTTGRSRSILMSSAE